MNESPSHHSSVDPARSLDLVADAYDRGRPSYPDDAVAWLLHGVRRTGSAVDVAELGAGTGRLTEQLLGRGCRVTATDPSEAMLARLVRRAPGARVVVGTAEQMPLRSRSADVVVAAQAFDCFDAERALSEVTRVLRPGGQLAVLWSSRDERVPWVRRLGRVIGSDRPSEPTDDPAEAIDESGMFEEVERSTFRFWQPMTQDSLRDLVASQPHVAVMTGPERERVLHGADELYEEYGRGHDGMLLPYVTTSCRATLLSRGTADDAARPDSSPIVDGVPDDALLIDFR
jgi:ubiquinone/menaquinone biosynthesis C-methylase UbiE